MRLFKASRCFASLFLLCLGWAVPSWAYVTVSPNPSTNGTYTVSWTDTANTSCGQANAYLVYEESPSGDQSTNALWNPADRQIVKTGKTNGTYRYWVRVADGCRSSNGGIHERYRTTPKVSVTVNITPPSSRPNLSTVSANTSGSYSVSWTSTSNTDTYRLQQRVGSGSWTNVQNTSARSKSFSGKSSNVYSYRVASCNAGGCGNYSSVRNVAVARPPGTPSSLNAPGGTRNTSSLSLSWATPSGSVSHYELDQRKNSSNYSRRYTGSSRNYTASGLNDGTYTYRVRACKVVSNAKGCSGWRTSTSTIIRIPPSTPSNVSIPGTIIQPYSVNWNSVSGAASYKLQTSSNASSGWTNVSGYNGVNHTFHVAVPTLGSRYFRVAACGSNGSCSGWKVSNLGVGRRSGAYHGMAAPSMPSTDTDGTFTMTWGNMDLATHFRVQKFSGSSWATINPNTSSQSYTVNNASSGQHTYRIQGCNYFDCTSSPSKSIDVARAPGTPISINVPTHGAINHDIHVSWEKGSGTVSHYELQSNANGGWPTVYSGSGQVANTQSETTGNVLHRIRACRVVGNATACSGWRESNITAIEDFSVLELTDAGINALNNEFQALFDTIHDDLIAGLQKSFQEKLNAQILEANTTISTEELENRIASLDSRLRDRQCSVLDTTFEHLLDSLEITNTLIDPLGILDPLNIHESIIDNIRDNPLDPFDIGIFGGGETSWSWTYTGSQQEFFERADAIMDDLPNIVIAEERDTMEDEANWWRRLAERMPPEGIHTITNSNAGASLSNDDEGFEIVCQDFNDIFDDVIESHLNAIHALTPNLTAEIVRADPPIFSNFNTAPGIDLINSQDFVINIPREGSWGITVPLRVRINQGPFTEHFDLDVVLKNLKFSVGLGIQAFSNGKFDITKAIRPTANFEIDIESNNAIAFSLVDMLKVAITATLDSAIKSISVSDPLMFSLVNTASTPLVYQSVDNQFDNIDQNILEEGLDAYHNRLVALANHPLEPIGKGFEYPKSPDWPEMEAIIKNIDNKIINQHMAFGVLTELGMDQTQASSWREAYSPGGEGNLGNIAAGNQCGATPKPNDAADAALVQSYGKINSGHRIHDDSAIWTGSYLAALAHRHKVSPSTETTSHILHALEAIEKLFAIHGNTGLLARAAAPRDSSLGRAILCGRHNHYAKPERVIDGVEWVGTQGEDGVSRDQYSGVLFGLNSTFNLVNNTGIKSRAKNLIEMAVDYMIDNQWAISEDSDAFNPDNEGSVTQWASLGYQKVIFLSIAENVAPGKYTQELEQAYPLLDNTWLTAATSSMDPTKDYYAQNLFYTNVYSYLLIEDDFQRRQKVLFAAKLKDYYFGHHNNAYFNIIRSLYSAPSERDKLFEQSEEILKRLMTREHRRADPSDVDTLPENNDLVTVNVPSLTADNDNREIYEWVVDPKIRHWADQSFWQGSGFRRAQLTGSSRQRDPYKELSGMDISLAYWMMRANQTVQE